MFFKRVVAELDRESQMSECDGKDAYLGNGGPVVVPQLPCEIRLCPALLVEVAFDPGFAYLRMGLRLACHRAKGVLGGDDELGGCECANEDDASIGFERENVGRTGV